MRSRYRVRHRTRYCYDDDVTDSLGLAYVTPRALPWQSVVEQRLTITPVPADLRADTDFYDNPVTYFQVTEPHRELVVLSESEVEVAAPVVPDEATRPAWESLRVLEHPDLPDSWRAADLALPTAAVPHDAGAREYAAGSLQPGRPVGDAVTDLMHRIHADFDYDPTATTVTSTVPEILAKRAGVCQDFAHLTLACLRGHGLAARYVSGYLATEPPPGKDRVVGADASHAWVAVWLGGDAWLPLDPTNDQGQNERYVTVAFGRDYADVSPVRGVIFTDAERSRLDVSVDVAPLGPVPGQRG